MIRNNGGPVTRGYGVLNRIVTRGYGGLRKLSQTLFPSKQKVITATGEYNFGVRVPLDREVEFEFGFSNSIDRINTFIYGVSSGIVRRFEYGYNLMNPISRTANMEYSINNRTDTTKLIDILKNIDEDESPDGLSNF